MKTARWLIGGFLLVAMLSGITKAQTGVQTQLLQPDSLRRTAYEYDAYPYAGAVGQASPAPGEGSADVGQPSAVEVPPPVATAGCCPDPDAPWKIPQPWLLQRLGIEVGGWVQQGITFNAQKPADRFNGPVTTNDRDREWQMNQAWLYFLRPTNTDGYGWDLGGRIDVVYGTDWRFGMNYGLEDQINGNDNFYGLVFPQFYLEAAVNRLTVKIGHFATMSTYEMVPAVGNFFYSHSHLMAGYCDPLLVTGLLADYRLNDRLSLVAGFHRGWMMFEDINNDLDFLGGFRWKSDSGRTNISFLVDNGAQDPLGLNNRFMYALVASHKFNDRFQAAIQHNWGIEDDGSWAAPGEDAQWYGLGTWLVWTLNPCWSAGLRFEWFRDDDGSRVAGVGNWIGSGKGWLGLPGFAGNFYDLSFGLNWRPNPNLVFRPEIRWDWYDGTRNVAGELPFDGGNQSDQLTFAVDVLLTY
ncbi:MAG: outer membrane beta-barrel protein [Thermoguttaceae bacterium]